MLITIPAEVTAAEQNVLTAAGWVVNSYRVGGGYTVPLSINLRSLADAVDAWRTAMQTHALDSDTNGFDRSSEWPGKEGHSNEQSHSQKDGRRGCASASSEAGSSAEAQSERTVRPDSAGNTDAA